MTVLWAVDSNSDSAATGLPLPGRVPRSTGECETLHKEKTI